MQNAGEVEDFFVELPSSCPPHQGAKEKCPHRVVKEIWGRQCAAEFGRLSGNLRIDQPHAGYD
jgi:hypothetical protein